MEAVDNIPYDVFDERSVVNKVKRDLELLFAHKGTNNDSKENFGGGMEKRKIDSRPFGEDGEGRDNCCQ